MSEQKHEYEDKSIPGFPIQPSEGWVKKSRGKWHRKERASRYLCPDCQSEMTAMLLLRNPPVLELTCPECSK